MIRALEMQKPISSVFLILKIAISATRPFCRLTMIEKKGYIEHDGNVIENQAAYKLRHFGLKGIGVIHWRRY